MVTAANDSKTVDALLKLGVADYLVKPFTAAAFSRRWISSAASAPPSTPTASVSQEELDALLSGSSQSRGRPEGAPVPHSGADPDPSGPGPEGGLHL